MRVGQKYKIRIGKEFVFDSSHQLPDEEIYGKCRNLHGHTYKLFVEVEGDVDYRGWLINFTELKKVVKEHVVDKYDHAHLNKFFSIPTAEVMAVVIFDNLDPIIKELGVDLVKIKLYETPTSYCEVLR